jgi:HemY protein
MMLNNQVNAAEKELKKHITKTWNKKLITLFAKLENPDLSKLSRQMDRWLVDRPRDANLWQAASHLAKRDELWIQAKQFIERSIEINENPIAYNQLGFILLELGQQDAAKKAFEQAINLNND